MPPELPIGSATKKQAVTSAPGDNDRGQARHSQNRVADRRREAQAELGKQLNNAGQPQGGNKEIEPKNPILVSASDSIRSANVAPPSNPRAQILKSIGFLRESFGNGPHLRGCCGPFSELIANKLNEQFQDVSAKVYQLADALPGNNARHAICIVRDKKNPNKLYLVDATVKQFDSRKSDRSPTPVKGGGFTDEINKKIEELRELGFTRLTDEFAKIYADFFNSNDKKWHERDSAKLPRSSEFIINRLATQGKFVRNLFEGDEAAADRWRKKAVDIFLT
ncbi:hypothetical protein [Microbulbifer sp. JMSA003]|uniref:hypothetical protein n=1 Tax=Microbulbifer sp. JMSA003 TaxID=3243369 RepID=UPI0040391644